MVPTMTDGLILSLNSGSSSMKFAGFRLSGGSEERVFEGRVERVGDGAGRFVVSRPDSKQKLEREGSFSGIEAGLEAIFGWMDGSSVCVFGKHQTTALPCAADAPQQLSIY